MQQTDLFDTHAIGLPVDPRELSETQLAFVMDYAQRGFEQLKCKRRITLSSWSALLAHVRLDMAGRGREQFRVLFLDMKNQLIAEEVMNEGTIDHAPVYPREVIRRALELDAKAIILVHNHPSGDPTPSPADVAVTRTVVEAGKPLGISVHDHLIVGRDGVESFRARGLL